MFLILNNSEVLSWDDKVTHKEISRYAAENSAVKIAQDDYLKRLGFKKGLEETLQWETTTDRIKEWIAKGGELEDAGNKVDLLLKRARSYNHFHNPLKQWDQAGLNDYYLVTKPYPPFITKFSMTGESALLWAQDWNYQGKYTTLEGDQTWGKSKALYLKALTSKRDDERQAYFAQTFKGLGHQMHLLQDMAVPAHVRNDAHVIEAVDDWRVKNDLPVGDLHFETWSKKHADKINLFAATPVIPQIDLTKNPGVMGPIAKFYDTDQYTVYVAPRTSLSWGLSEYTNANFVSDDTIFTEQFNQDDRHHFPYPRYTDYNTCYERFDERYLPTNKMRKYWRKKQPCPGESVNHFVQVGPWFKYALTWDLQRLSIHLDEATNMDYAALLVPRAVGYSAALLDYFFRAKIRLVPDLNNEGWFLIRNDSDENMRGVFSLYYDDIYGDRNLLLRFPPGVMSIDAHGQSAPVTFTEPADIRERGKYMLVFQGTHGAESGAIAGSVVQDTLEITPPGRFAYAVLDGVATPLEFSEVKAKVRNTDPEKIIKKGALQAIIQFKKRDDEKNIYYARSAPVAINSLDAVTPAEYSFDFSADPVDISVNSVYLKVTFRGNIGAETDVVAAGSRDISEPTPIDVFNNMDKVCINGQWHAAGSQEAIALVDTNQDHRAEEYDVYGHSLRDIYLKLAPADDSQHASPTDHTLYIPSLAAGKLYRAYVLSEYGLSHSDYMTAVARDAGDMWTHTKAILKGNWAGSALRDQDEYHTKQAVCAQYQLAAPCIIRKYVTYFQFRGKSLWGAAGNIIDNPKYPPDSQCSWALLK